MSKYLNEFKLMVIKNYIKIYIKIKKVDNISTFLLYILILSKKIKY